MLHYQRTSTLSIAVSLLTLLSFHHLFMYTSLISVLFHFLVLLQFLSSLTWAWRSDPLWSQLSQR